MQEPTQSWFERVPKVELHLHLEGAIPTDTLFALVQKYGGNPGVPDVQSLVRRFTYRDFAHFLETWRWMIQFLREYEDFAFVAEAVAQDLARQNIRYVEAFFSPASFARIGLQPQGITEAIRKGLSRVPGIEVALVADFVRDYGPEKAMATLAEIHEVQSQGVIGVGIGGSEQQFPPELFASVFEEARRLGFHTSAHAGEGAGAQSVWGAIRTLHVDRIGHGTRAQEDTSLLDYLARQRIPLEMCPISNLRTQVVRRPEEHPVRRYFERGIIVSVNTDDPKMFGNSMADEYRLLEQLGFSRAEMCRLTLQAIQSSWLPADRKNRLCQAFTRDDAWVPDAARSVWADVGPT